MARAPEQILTGFIRAFEGTFRPPIPYRGQSGSTWLVSRVWSTYLKAWLSERYVARFESPAGNRRRLDAALWAGTRHSELMDLALEWEWDNDKVHRKFPVGDFTKVLAADAACGLAIVQTRVDGSRGARQADETLQLLRESYCAHRRDDRPIGVIEIRRVHHSAHRVEFASTIHTLHCDARKPSLCLRFPDATV